MDNWKKNKLKNCLSGIKDGTHGTHERVSVGEYLLSAKNIKNGEIIFSNDDSKISKEEYEKIISNGYPKKNDILFTCVGTIGNTCLYPFEKPLAFQRSVAFIRLKGGYCPKYFTYCLQSELIKEEIEKTIKTTAQSGVYLNSIKNIFIDYPEFDIQRLIANFLDEKTGVIDSAVEELVKQRKLLEELKQATIHKAVTKGLDDNVEMKDSGVEWIGEIPKDKNLKKIKNILKVFDKSKVQVNEADIVGKYPFFTSSKKLSKRIDSPLLEDEEVIIMGTGGFANVHYYKGDLSYSTDCWCVKSIENVKFLYYYLTSIKSAINTLGFNGMGLKHLQKDFINSNFVVSFDIEEQNKIVSFLDDKTSKIDNSIKEIDSKITHLKEYKKTLINDAVTGKIKVYEGDV